MTLLQTAGVFVLAKIEDNIKNGIDYDGNKFSYSGKPFYRPYDAKLYLKLKRNPSLAKIVTNKNGKLGFIINGYKAYKQFMHPQSATNFLTVKGEMLRDMKILNSGSSSANGGINSGSSSGSSGEVIIGFSDPAQSQKAYWFNISGVGKSRKLWKFLGITDAQKAELNDKLGLQYKTLVEALLNKTITNIN